MRHFAWCKQLISGAVVTALTTLALTASLVMPVAPAQAAGQAQKAQQARLVKQLSVGGVYDPKTGGFYTPLAQPDYTPVDPTQLQPDIPAMFAGTKDPHGDPNYEAEIEASLHATDLKALDAIPAPTSGPLKVNPSDKLDVVRMKKNGGNPVIVALPSQMTPSSINAPTEFTVWYKEPGCVQPPKGLDPGKATPQERNAYGYPPLHPGESVKEYDARLSWMKERVCEYRIGNNINAPLNNQQTATAQATQTTQTTQTTSHAASSGNTPREFDQNYPGPEFTGNFVDEPCVEQDNDVGCSNGDFNPYVYNDTFSTWILRGVSGSNTTVGVNTVWMGLGGLTNYPEYGGNPDALVQSGSENWAWALGCGTTTCNKYSLWVENEMKGSRNGPIYPWGEGSSNYNIRVYAEEWGYSNGTNAESEVGDETNGHWYSTNSFKGYNYGYNVESAEAIIEGGNNIQGAGNPQFSSDTFNGLSVYDSRTAGASQGYDVSWHDWFKSKGECGNYLDTISNIFYDGGYSPPDDNTITWSHSC